MSPAPPLSLFLVACLRACHRRRAESIRAYVFVPPVACLAHPAAAAAAAAADGRSHEVANTARARAQLKGVQRRARRGQHGHLRGELHVQAGDGRVEVELDEEGAPADVGRVLRGNVRGRLRGGVPRRGANGVANPDHGPQARRAEDGHGDVLARVGGRVAGDEPEVAAVAVERGRHAVDDGHGLLARHRHGDFVARRRALPG